MDLNEQHSIILQAIAISSLQGGGGGGGGGRESSSLSSSLSFTTADRQTAFNVLENLKQYSGRIALCISWLQADRHVYMHHDITVATKLLALEIIFGFLNKGEYANASESDRLSLRQAVLKTAQLLSSTIASTTTTSAESNNNPPNHAISTNNSERSSDTTTSSSSTSILYNRILAKKIAKVLAALVIRDFPQRWTTFVMDVLSHQQYGGLWYNEPSIESGEHVGIKICLECLKLMAEDCTDSDFNTSIPTTRRNDVLIGLNEISHSFLPLLFQLLEHYPFLQQMKSALHSMHTYLIGQNRTISNMGIDESTIYQRTNQQCIDLATMLAETLITLEKFCFSMPVTWMIGDQHDFLFPIMFLLREPTAQIQVHAAECLEQLACRGKLEFLQWMRLISDLPAAIQESNNLFTTVEMENRIVARRASGHPNDNVDPLVLQLDFHRALSKLLSTVLSSYLAHLSSSKSILSCTGEHYDKLHGYLRLVVELLHHPSGRICSEQINMWTALLRDPQISKSHILQPFIGEIMSCYMDKMIKIRWDDVEDGTHPHSHLLTLSFDDEDEYDSWMADLRSRASLLYKFAANTEPHVTTKLIYSRVVALVNKYGNGNPLNFLELSNNQLTQKSDAVIQFEGIYQPLDNILGGVPSWAMDDRSSGMSEDDTREEIRLSTRSSLSEMTKTIVSWNPTYVWLKFRRASLLEALKFYWKYDSSMLLQGIESLIQYLGLQDEWGIHNSSTTRGGKMSGEIVGLKKKSGVALVAVSKAVPQHLVPWLSQLSEATRSLLSSDGLIPMNQLHLYEFLSCVATAVEDPLARSNFIGGVLSNAIETLETHDVQQMISTVPNLLTALGVTQASENPNLVTEPNHVRNISTNYHKIFNSLNQLLSVGRRCHEAARRRPNGTTMNHSDRGQLDGVDCEGPTSIQELALNDPFVQIWPRILPALIQIYDVTLRIWRPEHQAIFLRNPYQRYLYAISEDEAFLSKKSEAKSGGVFGEGGTAGTVVAGASRRDMNLVPKWSGWFNELRNTCLQMFGLLAVQLVQFSPEVAPLYPRLVAVLADPISLRSMEHRHFVQFLKHVMELMLVSCPSSLYRTHIEPIAGPVFEHVRFRLEKTWLPVLGGSEVNNTALRGSVALSSVDCEQAAELASRGGDEWFSWYYAHSGLFTGDLDAVTAEGAVEKWRVELSRIYSDVLQVVLALKGDWALVLANQAKDEQVHKRSGKPAGPRNRFTDEGVEVNADGTPKVDNQAEIDARKMRHVNALCHFMLLESEQIAGNLTVTIIQCLGYPDEYTCRRVTKICHRILETVAWSSQYASLLGQQMFTQAVKNIVTEPKWMVGIEWDMINVIRDIYCRLVLGQVLQFGGQGPGQLQPLVPSPNNQTMFEQCKTVDKPLLGGGILDVPSDLPRQVLASLPGIDPTMVREMENMMQQKRSAKDQKDFIRDLLRVASDKLNEMNPLKANGEAALGLFDRAVAEESLLHSASRTKTIPDLPEKLITWSQIDKANKKRSQEEPEGLVAFHL